MSSRKPCHNCRRRRLRCDRSVPACYKCSKSGQACLGYEKLIRWVGSSGPVTGPAGDNGRSLPVSTAHIDFESSVKKGTDGDRKTCGNTQLREIPHNKLNIFLADPLLQDLSGSSRYYLSYFATRFCQDLVVHDSAERGANPFRELIPMSQTYSYLQHIIIAVSAVHYYQAKEKVAATSRVLIDALRARHCAIRGLIAIIEEQRNGGDHRVESQADQDALLATVLFFVNFTLIDSGKSGWKDHLTVAGRLLSVYVPPTNSPLSHTIDTDTGGEGLELDGHVPCTIDPVSSLTPTTFQAGPEMEYKPLSVCDYISSDTIAYFIWNCAVESLVSPSPSLSASNSPSLPLRPLEDYAAQPLTWDVSQVLRILTRTEANSYHSCPAHLLGIVLRAARITQQLKSSGSGTTHHSSQMDGYLRLLSEADTFDVEAWATGVSTHVAGVLGVTDENKRELRLRCHIAAAYRAAVCLYILLAAPGLPAEVRRRTRLIGAKSINNSNNDSSNGDEDNSRIIGDDDNEIDILLPTLPTTTDLATTILQQLTFIPKTSPLFKYTVWPVFLTGVDAPRQEQRRRRWVTERLSAMRDVCPWGMMTSAIETLAEIWQLRDGSDMNMNIMQQRDATAIVVGDEAGLSSDMVAATVLGVDEDDGDWLARLQGLRIDCLIV